MSLTPAIIRVSGHDGGERCSGPVTADHYHHRRVPAFTLLNGMRAAGAVKFFATVSAVSMWVFRVGGSVLLCRRLGVGLIGVWPAWSSDWAFQLVVYAVRYRSGK